MITPKNRAAALIRQARLTQKKRVSDLAAYLQVTRQFWYSLEQGKQPIPKKFLKGICRKLGIEPISMLDALMKDYAEKLQNALTDNFGGDSGIDKKSDS